MTPSPVTPRNANGSIERFQDWIIQSPELHGTADTLSPRSPAWNAVVHHSYRFLELASNTDLNGEALRGALQCEFFNLAPDAKTGGSEEEFLPRQ